MYAGTATIRLPHTQGQKQSAHRKHRGGHNPPATNIEEGEELLDVRLKFTRGREVMFISHLDLMRAFSRALRRGRVPVSFTQGFNPHAIMVFGLPLQVGVTSDCEYLDIRIECEGHFAADSLIDTINAQLPNGIVVLEAKQRQGNANIMSQITHAAYSIALECPEEGFCDYLKASIYSFLNSGECIVNKTTKKGSKEINIRPFVKELEVEKSEKPGTWPFVNEFEVENSEQPDTYILNMLVSAGSNNNLKPWVLLDFLGICDAFPTVKASVHRSGLFVEESGKLALP